MNRFRLAAAASLALALCARDAAACAPNWVQSTTGIFGSKTLLRAADFDGDGRADLAGFDHTNVRISLTAIGGAFGTSTVVAQASYLGDLAVADVHGDGKLDLVAADTAANLLIVIPGNGDGTFDAAVSTQLPISPTRIAVRDFTGDGKADVAFRSYSASTIGVWKGDGANGFTQLAHSAISVHSNVFAAGDFDNDGFGDLVAAMTAPRVDVLFGNGDGTFDAPVQLTGGNYATEVAVADLDDDGDADFATSNWTDDTMTVFLNTGSRAFVVDSYNARLGSRAVNPSDITLADVTQDGYKDAILAEPNGRFVATFVNNGNGTFREPLFAGVRSSEYYHVLPNRVVAGEFNGDGRIDIVAADLFRGHLALFPNNCGESTVRVTQVAPIVSVGQDFVLQVRVDGPPVYYTGSADASGTVRVMEGDTELAEAQLNEGYVEVTISDLPAGEHTLIVEYGGDEVYDPRNADPVIQRVTTETTTVTLELTPDDGTGYYAQGLVVRAGVTASNGGSPTGDFRLFVNGVAQEYGPRSGPPVQFWSVGIDIGSYEIYVEYYGNADFPPSRSAVHTHVVEKAPVELDAYWMPEVIREGQIFRASARFFGAYGGYPSGTVGVYEGDTLLGTATIGYSNSFEIHIANLTAGNHFLYFTYSGDKHFLPYRGDPFKLVVLPDVPLAIDAATDGANVRVRWYPSNWNASRYVVQRYVNSGWVDVHTAYSEYDVFTQPAPAAGTPYIYRVRSFTWDGIWLATSNVDMAMLTGFTDDPIVPGVTRIKAAHMTELVTAVNAVRAAAGLAALSLPNVAPGKPMTAIDVQTLRGALNDARLNLDMPSYPFQEILTAKQTRIRAVHLQELRDLLH